MDVHAIDEEGLSFGKGFGMRAYVDYLWEAQRNHLPNPERRTVPQIHVDHDMRKCLLDWLVRSLHHTRANRQEPASPFLYTFSRIQTTHAHHAQKLCVRLSL